MGKTSPPGRVKLVAGLIFNERGTLDRAVSLLARRFGPIDGETDPIIFNYTPYYNDEMGPDLKRKFISFHKPLSAENIFNVKVITNGFEHGLSRNGSRTVNIDPGYMTLANLVLLTTKNYTHRIYLSRGIYAETTLFYTGGTFHPWDWTYPDYNTKEYIDFFNNVRDIFARQLKGGEIR